MKNMIKILSIILIGLFAYNCSSKAEVTFDTALYSDKEMKNKIADVKKGTVVTAINYRNHNTSWAPRPYVQVKLNSQVGYISSRKLVIGQDPAKSVFTWGWRGDYKPFYDPKDSRYNGKGKEFSNLAKLPKDKIPLEKLLEGTQLDK
ncbi:MAG: hypothetical protein H7A25_11860 [Leptospiraceae bacterium]|nr:hypothetical protein [Leptospiraceae bacterium]MCP5500593.1 hypothetical protein [Leptospiraceae bacterium]